MDRQTRVLIVDDDERNVKILYEILDGEFALSSSFDGDSALVEVERFSPDVVLLDIMMPGIDGYEVCRRLKESDNYRGVKIILVSGKALTEERIKGYESGADDFVVKPFDMDEIYAKVQVFAKLKSMEEVTKLKTDFLNLVNHETGTPLNHIIGTSDLLLMSDKLDADVAEGIKDISTAAHKLSEKIQDILFLSKLKQMSLSDLDNIDVDSLIKEVTCLLGNYSKNIDIKFEIEDGLAFKGDFILIQKLLLYVLKNAITISSHHIICRANFSANQNGVLGVSISIEDSGPNISDSQLNNFFDPFYIDDLMLHSEGMNTVMAICSEIASLHQGTIGIARNESTGCCLTLWLPCDFTD